MHPLSPHIYRDQKIFEDEMSTIFGKGPRYVGHEKTIPNIGDFSTLKHEQDGRMLIHTPEGIQLISNICRHRQSILQEGRGNTKNITCALHKWSWKLSGEIQGAPHFSPTPCKNLKNWPIENWRGLLFEGGDDVVKRLEEVGYSKEINFENYTYHRTEYHECDYNWKTFMEVYSDDYHVIPFHLGLSNMVSLQELHWELNDTWHIQTVESNQGVNTRNTQAYKAWKEKCLKQGNGKLPKYGAIWFAHYPNLMIEVYPYTLTVSTLYPISPEKTLNVVEFFYYKDAIEGLIEAEEAAYMETVYEDDEIARRMERGRMALIEQQRKYTLSDDEIVGPYQEPMEIGTRHFHEWYQKVMS